MDNMTLSPKFLSAFAALVVLALWRFSTIFLQPKSHFPRIGPAPDAADSKRFNSESSQMIQEGYSKYKNGVYKLWTLDMDRLIVSHKFKSELNKLPRSSLRLTASERYVHTGMDVCEKTNLQYEVCAGSLTRNIGSLAQSAFDELYSALNKRLKDTPEDTGSYSIPLFVSLLDLVTVSTARIFVGPELCRNKDWLATATGYTTSVQKASEELLTYPAVIRPIMVHFLRSYRELRSTQSLAKKLLLPEIEKRKACKEKGKYQDMLQWLVDTAQGADNDPERLVTLMLFLNMASIFTTTIVVTNVLLDLCARPECIAMIREEIAKVLQVDGGIKSSTLQKLKKLDSFMRESRRMNSMGFLTFQRRLMVPLILSNNTTIPAHSYLSIAYQPILRDPAYYPSPETFDPLRFYNLRRKEGEAEKHQFASVDESDPLWAFGKFACPGRHWATAQIKLIVVLLLMEFDVGFPEGQIERPENKVSGVNSMPSVTQKVALRRRAS